jgi:hypothetical protein
MLKFSPKKIQRTFCEGYKEYFINILKYPFSTWNLHNKIIINVELVMVQNKPVGYQGLQLWFHKLAPPPMASSNQQQFKIEYVS